MRPNFSMRTSLLLSAIVLIWGTHLLLAPSFYLLSERTFSDHAQDIMDNISDFTLEQSYNHLEKAKSAVTLTKQLLNANVVNASTISINSLERYFFDQLLIHTHLAGIYVATPDGSFYYVSRNEEKTEGGFRTKIIMHGEMGRQVILIWRDSSFNEIGREFTPEDTYDPRKRPWYKQAVETGVIGWTAPYIFYTSKQPGVTVSGPSYWDDGTIKGIVGVDIDLNELSSFIGRLRVGKTGQAFIFNEKEDVIASKNLSEHIVQDEKTTSLRLPKIKELHNPVVDAAMAKMRTVNNSKETIDKDNSSLFISFEAKGKDYVAMFTPFSASGLNWVIGMYIPDSDYLGRIRTNRYYNLIATVVLSLLVSFLTFRFANAIISPIKKLQREARAIELQDMKVECDLQSVFSELQETADGFQRMKQSIIGYRAELRNQELIYRTIIQAASDAIILINGKRNISYLNPAAEKYFAISNEAVVGQNVHDIIGISWDDGEPKQAPVELEIVNNEGGHYTVEITLSRVNINEEVHTIVILRDISERCRSAELKKQLVQDLHDGIGGNLVNIKLLAQMNSNGHIKRPVESLFTGIAEICEDSILEIRSFMDLLDQEEVTWESLFADIHQYCARIAESHQLHFSKHSSISAQSSPPSIILALNLFKIIKEGMTNIIRHAKATTVVIDLLVDGDSLQCSLQDDGQGFPAGRRKGRGVISMKNRTEQLAGEFTLTVDNGTTIHVKVPVSPVAAPSAQAGKDT